MREREEAKGGERTGMVLGEGLFLEKVNNVIVDLISKF